MKDNTTEAAIHINSTPSPMNLDIETKRNLLKQLVIKEAERGFAGYLYELIPDVEQFYNTEENSFPKDHHSSEEPSKELMIAWIVALCDPVYIFELDYNRTQHLLELFIVIQPQEDRSFKELESYIQTVTLHKWTIDFALCQLAQFNQLRKHESLFHIVYCNAANLVYAMDGAFPENIDNEVIYTALLKAKENIAQCHKKSSKFFEKANLFQYEGVNELACYMLHQAAEIVLRGFVATFSGVGMRHHSIKHLLQRCSHIHKEFSMLFQTTREFEILAILEASYIQARYHNDFSVTAECLDLLAEKVGTILLLVDRFSNQCIDEYIFKTRHVGIKAN